MCIFHGAIQVLLPRLVHFLGGYTGDSCPKAHNLSRILPIEFQEAFFSLYGESDALVRIQSECILEDRFRRKRMFEKDTSAETPAFCGASVIPSIRIPFAYTCGAKCFHPLLFVLNQTGDRSLHPRAGLLYRGDEDVNGPLHVLPH